VFHELLRERIGCLLGEFRCWRSHDRQRAVLRKRFEEGELAPVPGNVA
jgi:hypothetical protein